VKLKTDENLPVEAADILRAEGHDVLTVNEQGLGGVCDADLAAVCRSEGGVLISLDVDFSDIRIQAPGTHPGIVVLRMSRQDKASILSVVRRLVTSLGAEQVVGRLWIVDERRIRVRE